MRPAGRILRALLLTAALAFLLALLASALHLRALSRRAIPGALLGAAVLASVWDRQSGLWPGARLLTPRLPVQCLAGAAGGALAILLVKLGMVFGTHEAASPGSSEVGSAPALAAAVTLWLFVAVAEECFFRGYLPSTMAGRAPPAVQWGLPAALFAAAHLTNPGYYGFAYLCALLIGLLLGLVVLRQGTLGAAIGFHWAWNALQEPGLLGMPERGGEIWYLAVLIAGLGLVWRFLPRRIGGGAAPHRGG